MPYRGDHGRATIDIPPKIVDAVSVEPRYCSTAIVRGSDMVKAIALREPVVATGNLQGRALGAADQHGLVRALELLKSGIVTTMALLGPVD